MKFRDGGAGRLRIRPGTIMVLAVIFSAVAAVLHYGPWFKDEPSEECKPVRAMLDFNREQTTLIGDKTDAGPQDYRVWADGLADRSGKVTDPELAARAVKLAGLASEFATVYAVVGPNPPRTDGKPPEGVFRMSGLNAQIGTELQQLDALCPAG
ncbi:hypothetical protein [Mycolicibacterium fallax]|uniref:Alanine and proline rich membrane protein n=1 Tax=Mycolicibacterium fallax TaxID=1793 RepID=A0A1X1RK92_MYCFA|nr:hypothetical protein [Mycolicibacterium fallax]ORV08102.1 hypothetical protein AWC04_02300 [Mycolicibacterium fallax]